ncbi:hypothetical protein [Pseudoalteromonas luteoviolacea]|uniref:hypothetical protein n=1 Tax=Pseudoalteromonas luteoviolacea TaxID=43657 RepID=UPI00114DD53E|nr:hypothetical protein [Pseudoalteromonas luteoviolacea]TQF70502.1 hypothetical protein FLM44_05240 [Pseudoalteromonas luteoviolacea]
MIKSIQIKGCNLVNVPADINVLMELGLNAADATNVLEEHHAQLKTKEIEALRKSAFTKLSDPHFLEAIRKEAMGDTAGAEEARKAGLEAVESIKERYPLPNA